MKYFTILFTSSGGGLSAELRKRVLKSKKYKIKIIAVDAKVSPAAKIFCDHFSLVPPGNHSNYFEAIKKLIIKYNINLVIPCSDVEALSLAKFRNLIETDQCTLACADYDVLKIISNKVKTYDLLKSKKIKVPKYDKVDDMECLSNLLINYTNNMDYVVVKPAVGRGGRNVSIISKNDVEGNAIYINKFIDINIKQYNSLFPLIIMEKLYEPIYDVDMLTYNGNMIKSIVRRRLNPSNPNDGHIIENLPKLHALAETLANTFGLSWLYDCDVMIDKQQEPVLLEVNPRPSGSLAIPVAAGINFIEAMISIIKKEKVSFNSIKDNKVIIPYTSLT